MTIDGREGLEREEGLVWSVEEAYDRAWCSGDLNALMKCLSHDAVLVNPRGRVAVGHDAIRQALGSFLAGEAKGSRHRSTLDRIMFIRPDVAIVDGHASISLPESEHVLEHPFTDVLVRDDEDHWVIAQVRAYQFEAGA